MNARSPPAGSVLVLPVRPSRRLHVLGWLWRLVLLAYAVELAVQHHWVAALLVAIVAVGACVPADSPWQSLWLESDGSLLLARSEGCVERVEPGSAGMRLGPHVLLVLKGATGTHRLLFGPDNLEEALLAVLRRRLAGWASRDPTGVHSVAASGSKFSHPILIYSTKRPPNPPRGELFSPLGVHAGGMPALRQSRKSGECE